MVRLFWAMGALWTEQATHFLREWPPAQNAIRGGPPPKASEFREAPAPPTPSKATPPVNGVANAIEEQFGGVFRGVYRIGRKFFW